MEMLTFPGIRFVSGNMVLGSVSGVWLGHGSDLFRPMVMGDK